MVWNLRKKNGLLILKLIKVQKYSIPKCIRQGIKQPINARLWTKAVRIPDITFSHHPLSLSNPQQGTTEKLPVNRLKWKVCDPWYNSLGIQFTLNAERTKEGGGMGAKNGHVH